MYFVSNARMHIDYSKRLSSVIFMVDLCEKYQNFVRLIICHAFGSGVLFHTY